MGPQVYLSPLKTKQKTLFSVWPTSKRFAITTKEDEEHGEKVEELSIFIHFSSKVCEKNWLLPLVDKRFQRTLAPSKKEQKKAGAVLVNSTAKKKVNFQKGECIFFLIYVGVSKIQKQVVTEDLFLKNQRTNGRSLLKFK